MPISSAHSRSLLGIVSINLDLFFSPFDTTRSSPSFLTPFQEKRKAWKLINLTFVLIHFFNTARSHNTQAANTVINHFSALLLVGLLVYLKISVGYITTFLLFIILWRSLLQQLLSVTIFTGSIRWRWSVGCEFRSL